jgi:hypothetical protein
MSTGRGIPCTVQKRMNSGWAMILTNHRPSV